MSYRSTGSSRSIEQSFDFCFKILLLIFIHYSIIFSMKAMSFLHHLLKQLPLPHINYELYSQLFPISPPRQLARAWICRHGLGVSGVVQSHTVQWGLGHSLDWAGYKLCVVSRDILIPLIPLCSSPSSMKHLSVYSRYQVEELAICLRICRNHSLTLQPCTSLC